MAEWLSSDKSHTGTSTTHNKPLILINVRCSQILFGDAFLIDICYDRQIQKVHFSVGENTN